MGSTRKFSLGFGIAAVVSLGSVSLAQAAPVLCGPSQIDPKKLGTGATAYNLAYQYYWNASAKSGQKCYAIVSRPDGKPLSPNTQRMRPMTDGDCATTCPSVAVTTPAPQNTSTSVNNAGTTGGLSTANNTVPGANTSTTGQTVPTTQAASTAFTTQQGVDAFFGGSGGKSTGANAGIFSVDRDGNVLPGSRAPLKEPITLGGQTIPAGTQVQLGTTPSGEKVLTITRPVVSDSGAVLYPQGTQLGGDGTAVHYGTEYTSPDGKYITHDPAVVKGWISESKDPSAARDQIQVAKFDSEGQPIGDKKTLGDSDRKVASDVEASKGTKQAKFDDCQAAYEYAVEHRLPNPEKYKCSTTNGIAKGTEIANQVLTGTGRSLVNQMGANAAQQARNGTLAGDQKAAAQMAKTSATYETALTVANAAAAAILNKKANEHKQNLAALNAAAKSDELDRAGARNALNEQSNARNVASVAAFKATMTALQGAAGTMAAKSAQKAAETNARLAQEAQDKINANAFKYDPNQLAPPVSNAYDPKQMAATSGTDTSATTSSDGSTTGLDNVKLGDGSDSGAGSDAIDAPKGAGFKTGATGGAGGGAAGGGAPSAGGGGSGSGGPSAAEDPKAAYASEFGTKERYETGGGISGAGGAKGAVGGKGGDGAGIDLNGLLAQFLPKGEDESAHRSILDSVAFGGNRNLANEEAPSYLDKNADLFQRIHETMSEKNRRGQLGI